MIPPLNLPVPELHTILDGEVRKVFDRIRGKYVALTPEELVRQSFVCWMLDCLGYPGELMANETKIVLNDTVRRCDTVLFRRNGDPRMIIEYKRPSVKITQKSFDQIVRYNMVLHADYLVVSNGLSHYVCRMDYSGNSYSFLREMPAYNELAAYRK